VNAPPSRAPVTGGRSAGPRRFDFLGPPREEGELGWLAHYRVRRLLGEGGVGLVFLAEDTQLSRPVALKVIKPEIADAPGVHSRFVRETQATAAIKHDHIVMIYQVGRDNDIHFLAMEHLQGPSLQSWLERGRKPSVDVVLRINSEPLTIAKLRGKVVLVHFWTNGCSNCVNNYPHNRAWQKRYADKGVVIIGIHTPETSGEGNVERIKAQAAKHGLPFPIAVDNDGANWTTWNNRSWPTVYVVDRRGIVRYGWEGELIRSPEISCAPVPRVVSIGQDRSGLGITPGA
jgi:peroxiredoxin